MDKQKGSQNRNRRSASKMGKNNRLDFRMEIINRMEKDKTKLCICQCKMPKIPVWDSDINKCNRCLKCERPVVNPTPSHQREANS